MKETQEEESGCDCRCEADDPIGYADHPLLIFNVGFPIFSCKKPFRLAPRAIPPAVKGSLDRFLAIVPSRSNDKAGRATTNGEKSPFGNNATEYS